MPKDKELYASILECLKDPEQLSAGFDLLETFSEQAPSSKTIQHLRLSLVAERASQWIAAGRQDEGFRVLYQLCLREAHAGPRFYDHPLRDRHLGTVLERHPEFTAWVESLTAAPEAPELPEMSFASDLSVRDLEELLWETAQGAGDHSGQDVYRLGRVSMLAFLAHLGAPLDARLSYDDSTVLHQVAMKGDGRAVRYLVSRGLEVDARDQEGMTPLFTAAWTSNGHPALRPLLESGADVHAVSATGHTALFRAAASGGDLGVSVLWEHGADLEASVGPATPLSTAAGAGMLATVTALLDADAVLTPFARREAKRKGMRKITAAFDAFGGVEPIPPGEARAFLQSFATAVGREAGISAVDSGDHYQYAEDGCEELLMKQYWDDHYRGRVEKALAELSDVARTHLAGQSDLMDVVRASYETGYEAGVSR